MSNGIAEAAAHYHSMGLQCPWDCWYCDPDNPGSPWFAGYDVEPETEAERLDREMAEAEDAAFWASLPEPPF